MRLNLKGLGLGRIGKVVVVANTPSFEARSRRSLVTVEEVDNGGHSQQAR